MPYHLATSQYFLASLLYKTRRKVKIILMFFLFSVCSYSRIYSLKITIMMKLLQLLMKRPCDTHIRYAKIILGVILILTGIVAFNIQNLELEDSIFGIALDAQVKQYLTYIILSL